MNTAPRGHMQQQDPGKALRPPLRPRKKSEAPAESAKQGPAPPLPTTKETNAWKEEDRNAQILLFFFFFNFYDVVLVSAAQQCHQP